MLLSVLFVAGLATAALAEPIGSEFLVNAGDTAVDQQFPAIAMDASGDFAVAWAAHANTGNNGVWVKFYDEEGVGRGPQRVTTEGEFGAPALAMDSEGDVVVAWAGADADQTGIYTRRLDGSGNTPDPAVRANGTTAGLQLRPEVAMDSDGDYVVVWASSGQDGSLRGVYGRRYNAAGTPQGGEFRVNSTTAGNQNEPDIAMDADGDFVVVWSSDVQDPGGDSGVYGQRYNASGAAQGAEFRVNSTTGGSQGEPTVAGDAGGEFVVAWASPGQDGSGKGVYAQRYSSTGAAMGGEFAVNTYTTGDQAMPSVASDGNGDFVVVWASSGQDGSNDGVFGQRFSASGVAQQDEFSVNTYTTSSQSHPAVAAEGGEDFAVVWDSSFQDGDGWGIYGQRFDVPGVSPGALSVDPAATGSSNGNGVLESGESVVVAPTWRNDGDLDASITGVVSEFTGGGSAFGATYGIVDGAADYGEAAPGATVSCVADCYTVTVSSPTRPFNHWDARLTEALSTFHGETWKVHVGNSFSDVAPTDVFYKPIETLFHNLITAGCTGGTTYCPANPVPRQQMAAFIARAQAGSDQAVPTSGNVSGDPYDCDGGPSLFDDVPPSTSSSSFCRHIHYIASTGVTTGCDSNSYCPAQNVKRGQMAMFIARAIAGSDGAVPTTYGPDPGTGRSYSCNAGSPDLRFSDVSASDIYCRHVHYLWAKGIVSGTSATTYSPANDVLRRAMAVFLVNGFELELYGP